MEPIYFYHPSGHFGAFSNFSRHPVRLKEKVWPTTEHYFQAQKFAGTLHEGEICRAASPRIAASKGRERRRPLRTDWENAKEDIMRDALRAKFTQHPELRELLLSTGDAPLVEHTSNDRYWGDGGDGSGKNRLGALLMELRATLRKELAHVSQ